MHLLLIFLVIHILCCLIKFIFSHHISIIPRVTPLKIAFRALTAATQHVHQLLIIINVQQLLEGDFSNLSKYNNLFVALLLYERQLKWLCEY